LTDRIWTIGHSTRSWEEFLELLATHGIEAIADVRRFPGSRRYPWFASEAMAASLPAAGIGYRWLPQLGGGGVRSQDRPMVDGATRPSRAMRTIRPAPNSPKDWRSRWSLRRCAAPR